MMNHDEECTTMYRKIGNSKNEYVNSLQYHADQTNLFFIPHIFVWGSCF
jgi:hypothetical protein